MVGTIVPWRESAAFGSGYLYPLMARLGRLIATTPAFAGTDSDYAHNLVVGAPLAQGRFRWGHLDENQLLAPIVRKSRPRTKDFDIAIRRFRRLRLGRLVVPRSPSRTVRANLALVARLFGLSADEREVLQFLVALRHSEALRELVEHLGHFTLVGAANLIGAATCVGPRAAIRALGPSAGLVASGLVSIVDRDADVLDKIDLAARLVQLAVVEDLDRDRLLGMLVPASPPPTLDARAYAHLAPEVDVARRLLAAAIRGRRRGVNLLFHGPTGTGKSELARILARDLALSLHDAGRADDEGLSPNAAERLRSLLLGHRLLAKVDAAIVFDELEDLFFMRSLLSGFVRGRDEARMSKIWFNRLLETNPVPTIWTTNDTSGVDPAFLRRFTYAIEFRPLGPGQRRHVWERHLGSEHSLGASELAGLAARFTVSPAEIASAVGAARLLAGGKPDRAAIEAVTTPIERLVNGRVARSRTFGAAEYRLDAVNSPVDLRALAERLAAWQPCEEPGASLCLHGPPGTGKSEFVRFLAHRVGRPLVARRVSDIESCWVGETEKNIVAAFREAEQDGAVLLFDEADSFLRDRRGARASWEVTAVNEFLQQLEEFRGVVACTTNLYEDLDAASLRRFTFKVRFDYLTGEQASLLLRSTFGVEAPARDLGRIGPLAPGDFAVVRRRLALLGQAPTANEVLAELRREVEARSPLSRAIGFGA